MKASFSLSQAQEICEDFEDLIDTEYRNSEGTYFIDHIAIAPYDEADKEAFIRAYLRTKNPQAAINQFDTDEYDVLIFAVSADDDTELSTWDIRTYIKDNGVRYNFPG